MKIKIEIEVDTKDDRDELEDIIQGLLMLQDQLRYYKEDEDERD